MLGCAGINVLFNHGRQNVRAPDHNVLHCGLVNGLKALQLGSAKQHDVLAELLVCHFAIHDQEFNARFSGRQGSVDRESRRVDHHPRLAAKDHINGENDLCVGIGSEIRLVSSLPAFL